MYIIMKNVWVMVEVILDEKRTILLLSGMSSKLTYLNGKGLAEPIRILLKYGNVDFEDIRIERENWPALKASTPFGQVPTYEEDGKVAFQSTAIARYLAKKFGLVGNNAWEDLELDAIVDTINDLRLKAHSVYLESDVDKKEALKQTFLNETAPYYLERLEKLAENNNGYLAANKFTWADIFFICAVELIRFLVSDVDIIENYPNLQKVKQAVTQEPAIQEWIESRPKSHF